MQHYIKILNVEPSKDRKPTGWVGDNCLSIEKLFHAFEEMLKIFQHNFTTLKVVNWNNGLGKNASII